MAQRYEAVLFDLLTALLDSWTIWNLAAGTEEMGRRWRAEYLKRTYGCGAYRPYETLVMESAASVGLSAANASKLESLWPNLMPWPGVIDTLATLRSTHRLGVVTNCSEHLGHLAVERAIVPFDVVVTSERAGYYKPDPHAYQMALDELNLPAKRVLFVAGSGFDLFGTSRVGLDTFWHNHVGLVAPPGAPAPLRESKDIRDVIALADARIR